MSDLITQLSKKLEAVAQRQEQRLYYDAHVDTGRMRESITAHPAHYDPATMQLKCVISIGGTIETGIYREKGIDRLVDYAIVEAGIRHPEQVTNSIPEFIQDMKQEFGAI